MTLKALDHYTVLTNDVDASVKFYEGVLGLRVGARPPFQFPGAWLYIGDQAVLHLIAREAKSDDTGHFDHVAFRCEGYAETKTRLDNEGVAYREQTVPDVGLRQIFVEGPEGVWVELIFQPEDAARGMAA